MNARRKHSLIAIGLALGCATAALAQAQGAPVRYRLAVLKPMPGFDSSLAFAINNKGQVAFDSRRYRPEDEFEKERPSLWQNGKSTPIATPGSTYALARAINDRGWIAGAASGAAILKNGTVTKIDTQTAYSLGVSINSRGDVVGWTDDYWRTDPGAFLYRDGVVTNLAAYQMAAAFSINDRGQVAGRCTFARPDGDYDSFACIYAQQRAEVLRGGGLGNDSTAMDINLAGQVIGSHKTPNASHHHGFLYDKGVVTDLGARLPKDINEAGVIVGYTYKPNYQSSAFIRTGGSTYDLNGLTDNRGNFVLETANRINDRGEIVGNGRYRTGSGNSRAFVLRPILQAGASAAP
jgi:probable HAF family extracellular repeat protein